MMKVLCLFLFSCLTVFSQVKIVFPCDLNQYVGQEVEFNQTMFITNVYYLRNNQVTLSSKRLYTPTEIVLPSVQNQSLISSQNSQDRITLLNVKRDANNTRRVGEKVDNLVGTISKSGSDFYVTATNSNVNFYGNERKSSVVYNGDYDLKVCGFNLEYYIVSNFSSTGFGPANKTLSNRQHKKIMAALLALDCDIYGLVEVQQGQSAVKKLTDSLNVATNSKRYSYIADQTNVSGTYTKCAIIYRNDKVEPIKSIVFDNTVVQNRKVAQGFMAKSNQESFIFSVNHFKAKSGTATGEDVDAGDGQGTFNASRVQEAVSILNKMLYEWAVYYGDPDVLVVGDLNSHSFEDPITVFTNKGYVNQLKRFHSDSTYSYNFSGASGALDHAIANPSMSSQVVFADTYKINADEPTYLEYSNTSWQNNQFRSSDHDPVVVWLKLQPQPTVPDVTAYYDKKTGLIEVLNANSKVITIYDVVGKATYSVTTGSGADTFFIDVNSNGIKKGTYIIKVSEKIDFRPKVNVQKIMVY